MRKTLVVLALMLVASGAVCRPAGAAAPPAPAAASPLDPVRFLLGTWQGEGGGQPGQGSGSASFSLDLDGRVVLRRNHAEYPGSAGKPAVVHNDLMVIYPGPGTGRLEAVYFDNEGHVIEYALEVSPDGRRIVLTSEAQPSKPTFRLTYAKVADDVVDVVFEIAPPGAPAAFNPYVSGRTRRVAGE